MPVAIIRHPSMPQPQVPDHNVPTRHHGLDRRPDRPAGLLGLRRDPGDAVALAGELGEGVLVSAAGHGLLVLDGGGGVRAEPELGRAVLGREVAQRHVGDEVVRALRVVEGRVLVFVLSQPGGVGQCCVGREPVPNRDLA